MFISVVEHNETFATVVAIGNLKLLGDVTYFRIWRLKGEFGLKMK